ncbi:MAG TPA: AIR synthase-related protein [Spirochaetota bacterium]|nr:AIR synthase-related protein [Spirochaetota bacterium]HNT12597.1 AIR synthase-related protein [Spirochaetota bacterium]
MPAHAIPQARYRIEVFYRVHDARARVLAAKLRRLGFRVDAVVITDNYLVNAAITDEQARAAADMLAQRVTQGHAVNQPYLPERFDQAVEIGFLPGVTDNVATTAREAIEDLAKMPLDPETSVFTTTTYFFAGALDRDAAERIGAELANPLIQRVKILSADEYRAAGGMGMAIPVVTLHERPEADVVSLAVSDDELLRLGREGIADPDGMRRGPLALDMLSLGVIKNYFQNIEKRDPTDVELESIAQTWSEHCKHTIFAAKIDEIDEGIFKACIRAATERVRREKGKDDFCLSVFSDNAGGIIFDDEWIVADKVETHNSPSALDPFGGSITGIVGVNRDALGFGMGARPIANRYGFCFADPFREAPLYRTTDRESRLLSPRRIMEGVIHGVNVGGNCSGIPTPQGFVYFDDRYSGKPLVFVGTVGLIPREVNGAPSVEKRAMPGDRIVMVGGRVGRDGIHGATFSSEALSSGSPATAVQIGDPITQKKLSDAIVAEARGMGLYRSITDNGAGGLSCSVAEMARECGGFEVDLELVPLKYHGLAPWQIWVSESQERMTLAIPPDKLDAFLDLMRRRGVEATAIGAFTARERGIVRYRGKTIFDLDMSFLHDGLPRKTLTTTYTPKKNPYPDFPDPAEPSAVFTDMVARLNTASFAFISHQYDHEVQANSCIKPLQGRGRVNANATVIRPRYDSPRGVVLSQGLYPSYGDIDPYRMAACAIDTAVRNAVAVGGSLDVLALLDNFCWCDSTNPERLGELKLAARACYDYAVAYGTPFVSGKDSMFNDFRGYDEHFNEVMISAPPTLLVSSIGVVEDVGFCQTIDFKFPGDLIYLIGETLDETGGSEYLAYMGERTSGARYIGDTAPSVDAAKNAAAYRALSAAMRRGLVASSISVERGGLGVALAKSAMAGMLGCGIDLSAVPTKGVSRNDTILYSESQGRVLVSVDPNNADAFETAMRGVALGRIGAVTNDDSVRVKGTNGGNIITASVDALLGRYRGVFKDF